MDLNRSAPPEGPIRVGSREHLIFLLSEASELEHGIMCQYLFAAFSIKTDDGDGLTTEQLEATRRWERTVSEVAAQEMLHLALVSNMLTAIGSAPHFIRPNFPIRSSYYPAAVQLELMPFGERAVRHFLYLERPEGMDLEDAEGFEALRDAVPVTRGDEMVPVAQDFSTVGHLYRGIEQGLAQLVAELGEEQVFIGPPKAQATGEFYRWPELIPVNSVGSAATAIDLIVEQGEGSRGEWRDSHFGRFHAILEELEEMRASDPTFEPARPSVPAFVRPNPHDPNPVLSSNPLTCHVSDLFNASYQTLMQTLIRFFVHTGESRAELQTLADAAVESMFGMIKPLGRLLTTLPIGTNLPGRTGGPTFEVFRTPYFVPHQHAAWMVIHERLASIASACEKLSAEHDLPELAEAAATASSLSGRVATHIGWDSLVLE